MNYYKQVLTVALWEYRRFFKIKNELLGIVIMLIVFSLSYFGGKYATSKTSEKQQLTVLKDFNPQLIEILSNAFEVETIPNDEMDEYLSRIATQKQGILLLQDGDGFVIHSWKKPKHHHPDRALPERMKTQKPAATALLRFFRNY